MGDVDLVQTCSAAACTAQDFVCLYPGAMGGAELSSRVTALRAGEVTDRSGCRGWYSRQEGTSGDLPHGTPVLLVLIECDDSPAVLCRCSTSG